MSREQPVRSRKWNEKSHFTTHPRHEKVQHLFTQDTGQQHTAWKMCALYVHTKVTQAPLTASPKKGNLNLTSHYGRLLWSLVDEQWRRRNAAVTWHLRHEHLVPTGSYTRGQPKLARWLRGMACNRIHHPCSVPIALPWCFGLGKGDNGRFR
uniref:Uncharacterized protein TCIL3000_9_5580 n=1 Tax=Trypanosoma congolense (strain IL3000) TaxID=1068625 RepID=G0UUT6_TRYCI|nr:unnamed protein product [Trypanosoma congolense IL3000]